MGHAVVLIHLRASWAGALPRGAILEMGLGLVPWEDLSCVQLIICIMDSKNTKSSIFFFVETSILLVIVMCV